MSNDRNETILALYYRLGEVAQQIEAMRDSIARLYLGDVYATRPNEVGTTVEVPSWQDLTYEQLTKLHNWQWERLGHSMTWPSVSVDKGLSAQQARQVADMLNDIFGDKP